MGQHFLSSLKMTSRTHGEAFGSSKENTKISKSIVFQGSGVQYTMRKENFSACIFFQLIYLWHHQCYYVHLRPMKVHLLHFLLQFQHLIGHMIYVPSMWWPSIMSAICSCQLTAGVRNEICRDLITLLYTYKQNPGASDCKKVAALLYPFMADSGLNKTVKTNHESIVTDS